MRYVAAYCLAALGGKTASAKDIEKILDSVGVDCDADEAKKVVSELEGKDLKNVIAAPRRGLLTGFKYQIHVIIVISDNRVKSRRQDGSFLQLAVSSCEAIVS